MQTLDHDLAVADSTVTQPLVWLVSTFLDLLLLAPNLDTLALVAFLLLASHSCGPSSLLAATY